MKTILIAIAVFVSAQAFAFNEVECSARVNGKKIDVTVDDWGSWAAKDATLTIKPDEVSPTRLEFSVRTHAPMGFNYVRYSAPGFELEVDFWPDRGPQWGRTYRGTFRADVLRDVFATNSARLNCRFPNIH